MTNNEKLIHAFAEVLELPADQITDDLSYKNVAQWDSIAHMNLISAIEDAFDIMLDTEQILNMSSVAKVREILAQERDIEF